MEKQIRCKKCRRVLKSPGSVARGMGPKCAGLLVTSGKSVRAMSTQRLGRAPQNIDSGQQQVPLFPLDLSVRRLSKRALARQRREERRRLFENREPFRCGMLLPQRAPLVYVPQDDGTWMEDPGGRVISHERLQEYLMRFRFI